MFERFRKTKVQVIKPDVKPKHIMPNHEHIVNLGYEAKQYIAAFLKDLPRTGLMDFEDNKQFDGTKAEDAAWEAASDEEWSREYPMGGHTYKERIPDIVRDTMKGFGISKLQKQMDGIQKKLDRLSKLIENTEITMSVKTALKL